MMNRLDYLIEQLHKSEPVDDALVRQWVFFDWHAVKLALRRCVCKSHGVRYAAQHIFLQALANARSTPTTFRGVHLLRGDAMLATIGFEEDGLSRKQVRYALDILYQAGLLKKGANGKKAKVGKTWANAGTVVSVVNFDSYVKKKVSDGPMRNSDLSLPVGHVPNCKRYNDVPVLNSIRNTAEKNNISIDEWRYRQ